jgi:hypothetical protein
MKHREGEFDFREKKEDAFDFKCTRGSYCYYCKWIPKRRGHNSTNYGCGNLEGTCAFRRIIAPEGTLAVWDEEELERKQITGKKEKR